MEGETMTGNSLLFCLMGLMIGFMAAALCEIFL
jgi:hypothetical protein